MRYELFILVIVVGQSEGAFIAFRIMSISREQ